MKRAPFFLLVLASCGGNVVVDGPSGTGGHGGAGGVTTTTTGINTTGTSIDVSSSSSLMTSTSVVATSVSTGPMQSVCGSLHVSSDPSCELCAQADCCMLLASCDHGTDCGQLLQCVVNCAMNDMTCSNACAQKFPNGLKGVNALGNCLGQCMCNQSPTAVCDSGLVASTTACDTCLTAECCPEAEKCAGDPVCQKCLIANAGPQCAPSYAPLAACKSSRCPSACP